MVERFESIKPFHQSPGAELMTLRVLALQTFGRLFLERSLCAFCGGGGGFGVVLEWF